MKILVTGGAGFIGSNFIRQVLARGTDYAVVNYDKLTYAGNLANLESIGKNPNYQFVRGDICDAAAVEAAMRGCEAVVHFAAESHVDRSIYEPAPVIETNVTGTFILLQVSRKLNLRRFVHISTDEVYGDLSPGTSADESSQLQPSSPYSASKAASDHLVRAYARTYGLATKITNCSNNYGPYQFPEKLIPLTILNAIDRKPLPVYGQGLNVRDWLYVEDHCAAIWAVIEGGAPGRTYNVGGNSEVRNIDVVRQICRLLAEETGAREEELGALVTYVTDRPGHDQRYAIDATRIKTELGWSPRETFETGLRSTVRWYVANKAWVDEVRSGDYRKWIATNYGSRLQP